jgi:hypothetical protein
MSKMFSKPSLIAVAIGLSTTTAWASDQHDAFLKPFAATILIQDDAAQDDTTGKDTPPPVADNATNDDERVAWYLKISAGVNMLQDADQKGAGGGNIQFKTGSDFTIAAGVPLSENLSIEIASGFTWNEIESYDDIQQAFLFDNTGYVIQIPIVASVEYAINLTDGIHLGLNAGAGLQISHINSSFVTFGTIYGTAYSFRYQAGLNLTFNISSSTTLGAYARYSGTSEANFDKNTQYPSLFGSRAIVLEDLQNVAIGAVLNIGF